MSTWIAGSNPQAPFVDGNNLPLTQGRLVFTDPSTTNPKFVYSNPACTAPYSLGYKMALAPNGQPLVPYYYAAGNYSVMLQAYVSGDPSLDASWANVWSTAWLVQGGDVASVFGTIGSIATVDTRASMKAIDGSAGITALVVRGCLTSTDGGGGIWQWVSTSSANDNLGTVCTPNSAPSQGRWIWVPPDDSATISAAVFGLSQYVANPADTYLTSCDIWASSNGYSVIYPYVVYYIQASKNFLAPWITGPQGPGFASANSGTGVVVTISGNGSVIQQLNPICATADVNLTISDKALPYVRPEWWKGATDSDLTVFSKINNGNYLGKKLKFIEGSSWAPSSSSSFTLNSPCEFDYGSYIYPSFTTGHNFTINGEITTDTSGPTTYWQIFKFAAVSGTVTGFGPLQDGPVHAWWFGWGTYIGDNSAYLNAAAASARGSSKPLVVDYISNTSYGIGGAVNIYGTDVQIPAPITLLSGATLSISGISTPRRQIFYYNGAADSAVTLTTGMVYPEWFGAKMDGATDDSVAIRRAIISCASGSQAYIQTWVDGGGRTAAVTAGVAVTGLTYVGIRDIQLTTTSASAAALAMTSCSGIQFRNLSIVQNVQTTVCPLILDSSTLVDGDRCVIQSSGSSNGYPLPYMSVLGSNQVKFTNSQFSNLSNYAVLGWVLCNSSTANLEFDYCVVKMGGANYASYAESQGFTARNCQIGTTGAVTSIPVYSLVLGGVSGDGNLYTLQYNQIIGGRLYLRSSNNVLISYNDFYDDALTCGLTLQPVGSGINPVSVIVKNNTLHNRVASSLTTPFIGYDTSAGTYSVDNFHDFGLCVGNNDGSYKGGFLMDSTWSSGNPQITPYQISQASYATYVKGVRRWMVQNDGWSTAWVLFSYLLGGAVIYANYGNNPNSTGSSDPGTQPTFRFFTIRWPYGWKSEAPGATTPAGGTNPTDYALYGQGSTPGNATTSMSFEVSTSPILP